MTDKVSGVFFVKRRVSGSNIMPQMIRVEDVNPIKSEPMVTTMHSCLSPLLTTMKVFGLYFKRGTDDGEQASDEKPHSRCNLAMIYAAVVVVLMWMDMIRMFSVFSDIYSSYILFTASISVHHTRETSLILSCTCLLYTSPSPRD